MRARILLSLLLFFAVQLGASSAVGTIAVKPAKEEPADPRLDEKITLKTEKARLPDVLAEASRQAGVEIRVDPASRFWAVRQRKVTAIVRDMPLKDFMAQLKLLLGYHITRTGRQGHQGYIVWQDLKGRKQEQDIVDARLKGAEEARRRSIYETLADAKRVIEMTPGDIERAKKTDPWLAHLASNPNMLSYASLICAIPPRYFDELLQDGSAYIDLDKLPPDARAAVGRIETLERPAAKRNYAPYGDFAVSAVSIRPVSGFLDASTATEYDISVFAKPTDQSDPTNQHTVLPLGGFRIAPSDGEPRLQCAALVKYMSDGKTETQAQAEISRQLAEGRRNGQSASDVLKRLLGKEKRTKGGSTQEAVDPELDKPVKLKLDYGSKRRDYLEMLFEKLAEKTNLNLMYEHFNKEESPYYGEAESEQKLVEMLNGICSANGLEWTKDQNTLRFRCNDWALRRSWEISDDLIKKWRARIEKNSGLKFDDLVDMAAKLTDEQVKHNFDYNRSELSMLDNPRLAKLFAAAGANMVTENAMRSPLEFCTSLTDTQKKMLWSKQGLPIDEVPVEKWPRLNGAITLWEEGIPIYGAVFTASMGTESDPKAPEVSFHMKARAWLSDLPEDMRQRQVDVLARESPDKLANSENEPTEIEVGNGFSLSYNSTIVKKLVEEIREDERKQAEEKAKDKR